MKPAFWDTSALVPLCIEQETSSVVRELILQYEVAVWWATSVEICSALERLSRTGKMTASEHKLAKVRLDQMRSGWRELQPSETLRRDAESFLARYSLRAADALQLAAAWTWSSGNPQNRVFIAGDSKLLAAASQAGFQVVAA